MKSKSQKPSLNETVLRHCFIGFIMLYSPSVLALGALPFAAFDASRAMLIPARSQGVEIPFSQLIPVEVEMDEISHEDVQQYIPLQIPAGSDGSDVANKILNRSLKTITKRITEKNKNIAKAAESLQNLETDMTFGSSSEQTEGSIEHKISFRVDAFETLATVKYRGLVQADLSFDIAHQNAALEIQQDLGGALHLSLMQNISKTDSRSYLQIQFQY